MIPSWMRGAEPSWQKSSFCASSECAEVAKKGEAVFLRNSTKQRRVVRLSADEWQALLRGAKAGEFDDLG
jgi:Domain of unknown function (DUF397)